MIVARTLASRQNAAKSTEFPYGCFWCLGLVFVGNMPNGGVFETKGRLRRCVTASLDLRIIMVSFVVVGLFGTGRWLNRTLHRRDTHRFDSFLEIEDPLLSPSRTLPVLVTHSLTYLPPRLHRHIAPEPTYFFSQDNGEARVHTARRR